MKNEHKIDVPVSDDASQKLLHFYEKMARRGRGKIRPSAL